MGQVYVIMGVSGVGKTTVGNKLATELEIPFYDADDFHPSSNISKMTAGVPLTDEDRQPWLEALAREISTWSSTGAVLACSALKETYRETLIGGSNKIIFIQLQAPMALVLQRMKERSHHFFDPSLLSSQYKTLEPLEKGIVIDAIQDTDSIVKEILLQV